jgi:hypothetical protein
MSSQGAGARLDHPRPRRIKGKSRLKAPAQPALLNGSLLFLHWRLKPGIQQAEVQKKISISFTVASSSRMDGNSSCCGAQAIIHKNIGLRDFWNVACIQGKAMSERI